MRLISHRSFASVPSLVAVGLLAAFAAPGAARAQDDPEGEAQASASLIATNTCNGVVNTVPPQATPDIDYKNDKWRAVPNSRLAYFAASHSGTMVAPGEALALVRKLDAPNPEDRPKELKPLRSLMYHLQNVLMTEELSGLRAFDKDGKPVTYTDSDHNRAWLVRPEVVLRCKLPKKDEAAPQSAGNDGSGEPPVKKGKGWKIDPRLAGSVEALGASGEARKGAAAATVGYNRTRTFQADGSRTQTTEFSVKAFLGAAFDTGKPNEDLMVYGGYELKRSRATPPPVLVPPATARDGDTEVVTLGAGISKLVPIGGSRNPYSSSLTFRFDGAYKFDLVKDAERTEGKFSVSLYTPPRSVLGVCGFGGYTDFGNGFWSLCELSGGFSFNKVMKRGTLVPSGKDSYAHAGGKASIALFYGDPSENSAFLSGEYLIMPRISGDQAEIKTIRRHKIALGYRWWSGTSHALEVKAELTDGINPDSYADENAVTIGFGILF
ncbi:MAG TPA: hypothetical protein VFV30_05875 [Novosphingobium sp.]|nr:hypothetical protein [Novosphingobium sp.]